ncbi:MAG: DsbA family protein [Janthinobacterium lividum]
MTDPQITPDTPEKAPKRAGGLSPTVLGGAALALSVLALGVAAMPYVGGGFGEQVRSYLLRNPQVLDEVLEARQAQEDQNMVASINAAVEKNPNLLAVDARDPAFGPADAKVTVIEFFDFRCPGCKAVAPQYRALMEAHPDVRFVFKDWPILDSGQTVTSQYAARAALAAHQQGKYLEVYDAMMAEGSLSQQSIDATLAEAGVNMSQARAALVSEEMTRHIADIHTSAAAMGLRGTPTFFVNGKASPSIEPRAVAEMIANAKG